MDLWAHTKLIQGVFQVVAGPLKISHTRLSKRVKPDSLAEEPQRTTHPNGATNWILGAPPSPNLSMYEPCGKHMIALPKLGCFALNIQVGLYFPADQHITEPATLAAVSKGAYDCWTYFLIFSRGQKDRWRKRKGRIGFHLFSKSLAEGCPFSSGQCNGLPPSEALPRPVCDTLGLDFPEAFLGLPLCLFPPNSVCTKGFLR